MQKILAKWMFLLCHLLYPDSEISFSDTNKEIEYAFLRVVCIVCQREIAVSYGGMAYIYSPTLPGMTITIFNVSVKSITHVRCTRCGDI